MPAFNVMCLVCTRQKVATVTFQNVPLDVQLGVRRSPLVCPKCIDRFKTLRSNNQPTTTANGPWFVAVEE